MDAILTATGLKKYYGKGGNTGAGAGWRGSGD